MNGPMLEPAAAASARAALRGALAAAVTPLTEDGGSVDLGGIGALIDFYAQSGLDGLLILGTTGEGVLLSPDERRAAAHRFIAGCRGRLPVVVHCGAQSTRDSCALAADAAESGADGVAAISPPYYALDDESIFRHLLEVSRACAPTAFYVYEFAARSGYPVATSVIERLRASAANLAGLKVSDAPFDRVQPYLELGLDVFIGAESLIARGLRGGAVGAVSGLAAALPELTVAAVREGSDEACERAGGIRAAMQRLPFQAALKTVLRHRGVPISASVRGPLRGLSGAEAAALQELVASPALASLLGG
jgi:dihydrodipicolinate synthase/N-acetylneuraminate lyase